MAEAAGVWLAIDTATEQAGVALHDGTAVAAEAQWISRRRHSAELAAAVQAILDQHGLRAADLAGIAVAIGPGSYTGLRVGLALAKGMALGLGIPLVGVPTLDVLAAPWSPPYVDRPLPLWAVLHAGRGRLGAIGFPPGAAPGGPDWPAASAARLYAPDALVAAIRPPAWVAGELDMPLRAALAGIGATVLPPAACVRRAGWLAELGRARAGGWVAADLASLAPTYLDPTG